jgi:hypothetical protein
LIPHTGRWSEEEAIVQRSDLSGEPIDGGSAVQIAVSFRDGRRQRLTVTSVEADELAGKGTDASSIWRRSRAWIRAHLSALLKWGAALLIASLVIPAATKQWSDRSKALELKNSIITSISQSTTSAVVSARELQTAPPSKKAASESAKLLNAWVASEALIDPSLYLYFASTDAQATWLRFHNVVYDYIALACCDAKRHGDIDELQAFFADYPVRPRLQDSRLIDGDPWVVLRDGPEANPQAYSADYAWVGLQLLRERSRLLADLLDAKPRGFSQGPRDLICDSLGPLC